MVQCHGDLNRSFDGLPTWLASRWRIVIDSVVVNAKDISVRPDAEPNRRQPSLGRACWVQAVVHVTGIKRLIDQFIYSWDWHVWALASCDQFHVIIAIFGLFLDILSFFVAHFTTISNLYIVRRRICRVKHTIFYYSFGKKGPASSRNQTLDLRIVMLEPSTNSIRFVNLDLNQSQFKQINEGKENLT